MAVEFDQFPEGDFRNTPKNTDPKDTSFKIILASIIIVSLICIIIAVSTHLDAGSVSLIWFGGMILAAIVTQIYEMVFKYQLKQNAIKRNKVLGV